MAKPRLIAFYLPQYHPIPENDEWWGKGFTEWTNVGKAKKLFPGHYQPKVPADLGYYDLRLPEVREEQAKLAKEAGITGFCYWHYWFGNGKELLEKPFKEVLRLGKPDFPFCLAWANESWYAKLWDKDTRKDKLLIEQQYGGIEDYTAHFYSVLPAFKDKRYLTQDGKPIFMIYKPFAFADLKLFMETWNELAKKEGLKGIFWIAHLFCNDSKIDECLKLGFEAVNVNDAYKMSAEYNFFHKSANWILRKFLRIPYILDYRKMSKKFVSVSLFENAKVCPCIISGWDHTPRSGNKGVVMSHYTPKTFKAHVHDVFEKIKKYGHGYNDMVFIKSWNEWAEGNYLEPDLKYGKQFLEVLKSEVDVY